MILKIEIPERIIDSPIGSPFTPAEKRQRKMDELCEFHSIDARTSAHMIEDSVSTLNHSTQLYIHQDAENDVIKLAVLSLTKNKLVQFSPDISVEKILVATRAVREANKNIALLLTQHSIASGAFDIKVRAFGQHCRVLFMAPTSEAELHQTIVPSPLLTLIMDETTPPRIAQAIAQELGENDVLRITRDSDRELAEISMRALGKTTLEEVPASTQRSQRIKAGLKRSVSFQGLFKSSEGVAHKNHKSECDLQASIQFTRATE